MRDEKHKKSWESTLQILAISLAFAFYGGLFLWMDIQEYGNFAAIFQDKDRMIANILMSLARLVR